MHVSAMANCKAFFDCYGNAFADPNVRVVEIGSQDVNGTLRTAAPSHFEYVGVDFAEAKGVDIVLTDPYSLPFEDSSVDIFLSSSCFEHSEFFWVVFLEVMRCLKPRGLFYLNAPSSGQYHRYPVDCWRFYPDSGKALAKWAQRNGFNASLLESFVHVGGTWQDFVAVFLKDEAFIDSFPSRIVSTKTDFENGQVAGQQSILKLEPRTQCERTIKTVQEQLQKARVAAAEAAAASQQK